MKNDGLEKGSKPWTEIVRQLDDTSELDLGDPLSTARNTAPDGSALAATQVMPKLAGQPGNMRRVRELEPQLPPVQAPEKRAKTGRKKAAFLVAGFLLALGMGFLLSGYMSDRQTLAENEQLHQKQELTRQRKELEQEKLELEKQKSKLEQQRQQAASRSEQLSGKSESILNEVGNATGLKAVWNKVSGKEKSQKTEAAEFAEEAKAAAADAASLKDSIAKAENMIDDVNRKIDDVDSMRMQVGKIKAAVQSTYRENADVIDQAADYIALGKNFVLSLLHS